MRHATSIASNSVGGARDTSARVGEASAGKVFTVTLKGNSDIAFFEARIDRVARLIKVQTFRLQKGWKPEMLSKLPTYLTNTETDAVADTRNFTFQAVARGLLSVAP